MSLATTKALMPFLPAAGSVMANRESSTGIDAPDWVCRIVLSPDVAERMAQEVLAKGALAVVPRAGHSVMTDNPDGFRDAVSAFVLGEG